MIIAHLFGDDGALSRIPFHFDWIVKALVCRNIQFTRSHLEISALTGKRSMYSVTAQTACDVFILSGHDTKFILGEYEEMRPLIEHEAIERILQIYKEVSNTDCFGCLIVGRIKLHFCDFAALNSIL